MKTSQVTPYLSNRCRITRRTLVGLLVFVIFFFPLSIFPLMLLLPSAPDPTCRPDLLSFLAPNFLYFELSITAVRAIDVSYNLLMGRALQGILAAGLYYVSRRALLRISERDTISFNLFYSMSLDSASIFSLGPMAATIIRNISGRSRATLIFLIYAIVLIFCLPTLINLEAGYSQTKVLHVQYPNGTIIAANKPQTSLDIIEARATVICLETSTSTYSWGFTFIWFIFNHCLISFLVVGMYGVWIDSERKSVLQRKGRKLGQWRAILDLADAIEHELREDLNSDSDEMLTEKLAVAPCIAYSIEHEKVVLRSTCYKKVEEP